MVVLQVGTGAWRDRCGPTEDSGREGCWARRLPSEALEGRVEHHVRKEKGWTRKGIVLAPQV